MRVRVGTKAWAGDHAYRKGETPAFLAGVTTQWVELDGHRFEDVASVTFSADDGFGRCDLTIAAIGTVEVVYLDEDGDELTIAEVPTTEMAGKTYSYDKPWWPNVWRRLRVAKARW